jgi:hypothetical protein
MPWIDVGNLKKETRQIIKPSSITPRRPGQVGVTTEFFRTSGIELRQGISGEVGPRGGIAGPLAAYGLPWRCSQQMQDNRDGATR